MKCSGCENTLSGRQTKWCSASCRNKFYVTQHRKNTKLRAVAYLGGKCERCGWDEHVAGLAFHHPDPSKKEFGVSSSGHTRSWSSLKSEIEKCHLLCHNCHAVVHATGDANFLVNPVVQVLAS